MWTSNYYNSLIFFLWLILQSKKPKKQDSMSLGEAIDDSENLTDFLMDFEEDNWYLQIPGYVYIVRLSSTNFLSFDNKSFGKSVKAMGCDLTRAKWII